TSWSYANTGYILLGLVIQRVTGHPLATELQRRILGPLGLRQTRLPTSPLLPRPATHGYGDIGSGPQDFTRVTPSAAWAAGALVSTADDVAVFYRALLSGGLLSPDLLAQMETTVPFAPGFGYGLGVFSATFSCGQAWGHDGDFAGFLTNAFASVDGQRQV